MMDLREKLRLRIALARLNAIGAQCGTEVSTPVDSYVNAILSLFQLEVEEECQHEYPKVTSNPRELCMGQELRCLKCGMSNKVNGARKVYRLLTEEEYDRLTLDGKPVRRKP